MAESFDLGALIEEFRDEARDQTDRLDAALLALEREGTFEAEDRSALLRTLHTLKGNAGMLGLAPIRDFVHVLENVVKGAESWTEEGVERLFEGASALRSAVEAAGTEQESEVFGRLAGPRRRLEEVLPGAAPTPVAAVSEESEEKPEEKGPGELVRVPFPKLDGLLAEVGELVGEAETLCRTLRGASPEARERADGLRRRADALRDTVMSLRLVPIGRILGRFHGLVRRLAREQEKEARLVVQGEETELDKSTVDALTEPLLHLVRNAIDHGIRGPEAREAAGKPRHGTIRIRARQEGDRVRIDVEDDGRGIALSEVRARAEAAGLLVGDAEPGEAELLNLVFEPGFSTRDDVSTVSGQGVGLDVVRRSVRRLRGELSVERSGGGGTRFVLILPLTVAVTPSLLFETGDEILAVPTSHVARTLRVEAPDRVGTTEVVREDDGLVPLIDPGRLFGWPVTSRGQFGVVIRYGARRVVLTASRLVDQRDLLIKALPSYARRSGAVSGGSVLPGGRVVLLLDPAGVVEMGERTTGGGD